MDVKELLGEELYAEVLKKTGGKGVVVDDGMLIPKYRFDCVNVSLREHKKLAARLAEENEALKEREKILAAIESENESLKKELRIIELILAAKPKNFTAVRGNIDTACVAAEKLDAFVKRRLSRLKESDPYLFYGCETFRLVPVDPSV